MILCDKGKRSDTEARARAKIRYAYLNEGHVPDNARPRQGANGVDIVNEVKVVSPHVKTQRGAGQGCRRWGGSVGYVGYLFAFGSTLEHYKKIVYGWEGTGEQSDGPLDHSTGRGWVRALAGDYADALSKGSTVNLLLHEVYGGMGGSAVAYLGSLAKLAACKSGRDDTEYHDPPGNKRLSFREHWARALSVAAALGDAARIAARLKRGAASA